MSEKIRNFKKSNGLIFKRMVIVALIHCVKNNAYEPVTLENENNL